MVVVATTHDQLAENAIAALEAGAHVLVEKPAGIGSAQVEAVREAAERAGRRVKVGFNHRFHPGLMRAVEEARSGAHGEILNLRARYGHGGRLGYEREWRADPARSGGGELIDQGMHLLDLSHWLLGPLPLHSALTRTAYWDMPVEDNAVVLLGDRRDGPWARAARVLDGVEEPVLARDRLPDGQAAGRRPRPLLRRAAPDALPDEA